MITCQVIAFGKANVSRQDVYEYKGCVFGVVSANTAGIYQFLANPCFKTTMNVWVVAQEVVFPAANLTDDDSLVFTAFMTKHLFTHLTSNTSCSICQKHFLSSMKNILAFMTKFLFS